MLQKTSLLLAFVAAQEWDYASNGADWADLDIADNECGGANQSPIDLYGREARKNLFEKAMANNKIHDWKDDDPKRVYPNGKDIGWVFDGKTIELNAQIKDDELIDLGFQSMLGQELFGADHQWRGSHMNIRAGSEHTIDGDRKDLELQIVHTPANGEDHDFNAAVVSILFSVEAPTAELSWAETRMIDTFFESMQLDDTSVEGPTIDLVTIGDLLNMVDGKNRFIYQGSLTTPPCTSNVYWNVLENVYPIQEKHVALFQAQLDRTDGLKATGNWREIQEYNTQDLNFISQDLEKGMIAGPLSMLTNFLEKVLTWVQKNK